MQVGVACILATNLNQPHKMRFEGMSLQYWSIKNMWTTGFEFDSKLSMYSSQETLLIYYLNKLTTKRQ